WARRRRTVRRSWRWTGSSSATAARSSPSFSHRSRSGASRASTRAGSTPSPTAKFSTSFARRPGALPGLRPPHQRAAPSRRSLLAANDRSPVLLEVVRDRLDPDLRRAGGLGRVEVLEREEERARALDDLLDRRVGRLVHPALVGRHPDDAGDPRDPRRRLGAPEDLVR